VCVCVCVKEYVCVLESVPSSSSIRVPFLLSIVLSVLSWCVRISRGRKWREGASVFRVLFFLRFCSSWVLTSVHVGVSGNGGRGYEREAEAAC